MKKTLADLFMEASGPTVQYKGLTVHSAVFRHVDKPGRFRVRFLKAVASPIQGLNIDIDRGHLLIAGAKSRKMILRLDTCPIEDEVLYRPAPSSTARLTLYNSWVDENESVDAWLVHAGMLVEETGNKILLRCSDGLGEPTFDDLIVEIEFLDD
ncbi:MAG: hypothetical protein AB1646_26720 [Thermodesulfobacteriota bacterium]